MTDLYTTYLNYHEYDILTTRILAILKKKQSGSDYLDRLITVLTADLEDLQHSMTASRASELTDAINELDDQRDQAFLNLKRMITLYTGWFDAQVAASADLLKSIIKETGSNIHQLPMGEQSSKTHMLFSKMDAPDAQAALEKINGVQAYRILVEKQNLFEETFRERAKSDGQKVIIPLLTVKRKLIGHLNLLLSHLSGLEELYPGEYDELVAEMNEVIIDTNTKVKARRSRGER